MVTPDENILKAISADKLVYGHSSVIVQNKFKFIEEILSGHPVELQDER